jgi:hypothetical protein
MIHDKDDDLEFFEVILECRLSRCMSHESAHTTLGVVRPEQTLQRS